MADDFELYNSLDYLDNPERAEREREEYYRRKKEQQKLLSRRKKKEWIKKNLWQLFLAVLATVIAGMILKWL